MAHSTVRLTSLVILLALSSAEDRGRWSRQISSYTSDISDWVPLTKPIQREPELPPIKRQAVAEPRILTEPLPIRPTNFAPEGFPSRSFYNGPNRQLYLQSVPSVPSAPQNYLTEQGFGQIGQIGQSIRFGLAQPNFPLNQGFISPHFGYDGIQGLQQVPALKPRPQQNLPAPIKFDSFPKATPSQLPLVTQPKPFNQQLLKQEPPKYVDGYRVVNTTNNYDFPKKKPVTFPKATDNYVAKPAPHMSLPKIEREEVQLLYVPLESINRGQFNFRNPISSPQIANQDLYSQNVQRPKPAAQEIRPIPKPADPFGQEYFSNFNSQINNIDQIPKYSTIANPFPTLPPTTPKPKKLKPHQPPLAIFLTEEASKNNQIKVGDVLTSLKNANSIAVLDSVNPVNAPKVFIGPSSLQPPERFVKFELPYLSNIEHSDKKLRQLPFFVAPLSYNTPQGFAKIPFPAPHVGSVVINSLIKETEPENVKPNYYVGGYTQEQKPATQKPTISYYSTATPQSKPPNYQTNYYSFEPQTVSTLRPVNDGSYITSPKPGNYFLSNIGAQYEYQPVEPIKQYTTKKVETTTTPRPVSTTTKSPSTYPSQLLETHNPYSINQAFHFSTPLDYHSYVEEHKEPVATPGTEINPPQTPTNAVTTSVPTHKTEQVVTEKQYYQQQQTSPNYLQNYSPEIHYESEKPSYPLYNNEYSTKPESVETYSPVNTVKTETVPPTNLQEYTVNQEVPAQVQSEVPIEEVKEQPTVYELDNPSQYENTRYENTYESDEVKTTTSTTTTRRAPTRTRGRPRYTTTPRTDSSEYTTRTVTRRPLRERRPLPTRQRYEPNKITAEKSTRKPIDTSSEVTTKTTRTRNRGRVTFKPTDSEEYYNSKKSSTKDQDLAYQRDVLHQNYPVTLMERMSTVDIEAITEPTLKTSPTRNTEPATDNYDTENAYTNEKAAVSRFNYEQNSKDDIPVFPSRTTVAETETPYSKSSAHEEEYTYNSRNPAETVPYTETTEREEDSYAKQTTLQKEEQEPVYATEPTISISDQKSLSYSLNNEYSPKEETTIIPETETTKFSQEEDEEVENVVQTTPSYNRVRVRPGVIKQYHQASTESTRTKIDRRRPVTYRPAFNRQRTTMRIDEIEADLKTKQVHSRPEVQDYKHPVYKPEPSTEPPATQEASTKRGQFRRRRPSYSYTTTSTEGSVTKKNTYEVKNRFRGRRPTTEKPTDKPETQTDVSTSTTRPLYTRYSHRPRLSERYNKKPEEEDQDSNYSINRPKYIEPEGNPWSSKISADSFKPYNPNDIVDNNKATTERRSDRIEMDIITARNDYDDDDILLTVTPASNNRNNKKIPEIPPTLEALVEQSKVTKSDSSDNMSTFESMLEEVMKSLEEQDENEYSSNVMKHKGGEIGEIPPERVISSDDGYNSKTTALQQETTTVEPTTDAETTVSNEDENEQKNQRRGFWKKVKVRPVPTESIEAAESQYYTNTVNRLGQQVKQSVYDKTVDVKPKATTYKPAYQFIKEILDEEDVEVPTVDIAKIKTEVEQTTVVDNQQTDKTSPGDLDLGTGSPDSTLDNVYVTTEPTTVKTESSFSFMDYLFGITNEEPKNDTKIEITTESKPTTAQTTEVSFIPDEITTEVKRSEETEVKRSEGTEVKTSEETTEVNKESSPSVYDPVNVVSTSMSTEISHETEICFRGKCIKTNKDIL